MVDKKYFPIKTETACSLKWNWSTLYLNTGITASCHRTAYSELTAENFLNFHNTPLKLEDRTQMLAGKWPATNCAYCRDIEIVGGVSDRMRHSSIPNLIPTELETDPTATVISPVIVEVYFSNACNLGCLYCNATLSSTIDAEDRKFTGTVLDHQYKNLVPHFWEWFPEGFPKIKRFHALGGEPLIQKEFDKLLSMIEQYPNPQCELNIITNLIISRERLEKYVAQFKQLVATHKLAKIEITASIDCLGSEQEYVRWGLDLTQWMSNFEFLLEHKWLTLNINQTISSLTIKTMPELLIKLVEWRKQRRVGHWFSKVIDMDHMCADIFGPKQFADDITRILKLMPRLDNEDEIAYNYMKGIGDQILASEVNDIEIAKLIAYLDEKDRRRGTNWANVFPWLREYKNVV
jgi:sulfatase maturation enzyme AslB (radical SAM superfamily)